MAEPRAAKTRFSQWARLAILILSLGTLVLLVPSAFPRRPTSSAVEVLVFTWDWPMSAEIPPLHIWKDGQAVWVDYGPGETWAVQAALLSQVQMQQVAETIADSDFWEHREPGFAVPDPSWLTIWVSQSGREKSVVVRDSQFTSTLASIREIAEASSSETELLPQQAYLFAWESEYHLNDIAFPWPDETAPLDFSQLEEGAIVDGTTLSILWGAVLNKYSWISSRGAVYDFSLKLPGLSCTYFFDEVKHLWECNIFAPEPTRLPTHESRP